MAGTGLGLIRISIVTREHVPGGGVDCRGRFVNASRVAEYNLRQSGSLWQCEATRIQEGLRSTDAVGADVKPSYGLSATAL